MNEDSDDISFVEEEEEEDVVSQLRRTSRPSDNTDASAEGADPLLSGINISGANSWQDVDRAQLSSTVLKLISSVASTAPTDDKSRDAVWHPTVTFTISQDQYQDPLGFGTIDLLNMKLERPGGEEPQEEQQQPHMTPSGQAMAAAVSGKRGKRGGQSKGAVGRFFSELTRQGSASEFSRRAELARQPSISAALAAAGMAGAGQGRSSRGKASSSGAGAGREAQSAAGFAGGLKQVKLLPSEEGFDPEAYLAIFHEASSAPQLAQGLRVLEHELGERTGQLKQLVKQNFERFISCKTTIDDIYVKLRRIESTSTGVSTEVLYSAIQQVQDGASEVFGPILERSAKAERIRSVQLLLRRFQGLFSAPQRISAHAAARDFEQVTAEFKRANGLIKPGPKTIKVWAALYAEIEKRVSEVYQQLQGEIQDPRLPAASASELVQHMLALQAEGLPAAQGQDPLALLLAAREARFAAAMQAVAADHERAVGRLRAAMAAAAADEKMQDPAAISEAQLLKWRGSWDGSSSSSTMQPGLPAAAAVGGSSAVFARSIAGYRGSSAAAAAAAGAAGPDLLGSIIGAAGISDLGLGLRSFAGGVLGGGLPGSKHLSEVAPLSGLQPPAPRSRLVQDTRCTAGELLYLKNLQRHSEVLLECLPGLWQAAGTSKLQLPLNLPASAAAKLQQTLAGAAGILQRLVSSYCKEVGALAAALAGVGPLREALLAAAEELAYTIQQLEAQEAPGPALEAVQGLLGQLVASGVQQLAGHLHGVPAWLIAREGWQLSVTHSGSQPITMMPEQLQEEVTVAMQYYQQLLGCSTGSSTGSLSSSTSAARGITADVTTKPIRDAYFTVLGAVLSDDVRLLLMSSNLSFMRERLVGSLTQRFLLVLTGEVAAEVERCSRYVVKLAGRLDSTIQAVHGVYFERKRRSIDRLLGSYIKPDGQPVGVPPDLREVSPHAQQLVQLVAGIQSETFTYARLFMQQLLHAALEHLGSALSSAFASLPNAGAAAAGGAGGASAAAAGCPVEALGQYFMDLVYLDAVLSKAGPQSLSVDMAAAYQLLSARMCAAGSRAAAAAAETPLARSLLAIKDPQELNKKLQEVVDQMLQTRQLRPQLSANKCSGIRPFSASPAVTARHHANRPSASNSLTPRAPSPSGARRDFTLCQAASTIDTDVGVPTKLTGEARSHETDVVIIGSGIGGLCCGALLAKYGVKVTVVESHSEPGGAAHTWQRGGYHFESGPSLYSGMNARGKDANPLAHVLQAIGEPLECVQYNTWNVLVPEGQFLTRIGNDNFLDVLSQIRGPGSPAIAEWRRLQEVMRPLAKAAVLLPPVAFRWVLLPPVAFRWVLLPPVAFRWVLLPPVAFRWVLLPPVAFRWVLLPPVAFRWVLLPPVAFRWVLLPPVAFRWVLLPPVAFRWVLLPPVAFRWVLLPPVAFRWVLLPPVAFRWVLLPPVAFRWVLLPPVAFRYDPGVLLSAIGRYLPALATGGTDAMKLTGPFSKVLDGVVADPFIRNWLDLLSFLLSGLPANGTIAAEVAFMFNEWYRPDCMLDFPVGGSQAMVQALIRGLEKRGGRLLLNSHVERIQLDSSGRATGVALRGNGSIKARKAVVSNASVWNTVRLLPPDAPAAQAAVSNFNREAEQTPNCPSFMHLHIGFDKTGLPDDLELHHIIVNDWSRGVDAEQNVVLISIPSVKDPSMAPAGKHCLHAYLPATEPYHLWKGLDRKSPDYAKLKEERSQVLWKGVEKIIPDIRSRAEVSFVGTPLTHERYLRRARGSYGPAFKAGEALFPGE
ncbi:hypothetical protein OEZ85_003026 [Tetradesmus obliquus]|uniref:Exocyst complex component Sec8 n=1 Tax=Tetradesmus obliquus TaxID=3088 RepID=A0ABY8U3I5_TETOB|nr:hypothetical protein OEZ85_003026 [Tetradesmus obliquus]